ncbi:MAG: tetratricopeptide repeat protein [Myxococcota bacterium]
MTWKFDKLMEDSKTKNDQGCQAALLLAYHHDYLDKLNNCEKIIKNKLVYRGSNLKAGMNILRTILLQRNYSDQTKNKIYQGNVLKGQKEKLSSLLEKKISQNRKSNFWNYLMVLFLMENNKYALAREKLNMINSKLVEERFSINILKARCGEKKINADKFSDKENKLLKIAQNAYKLEKIQNKGFFPPLAEKFEQSFTPQKDEIESFGPRYSVLAMAARVFNRWLQGHFSNSWLLCKEIIKINKFNKIANTTCLNIFSYNSLFKKINTAFIKPNKDWVLPYKIAAYLNLNKQIKAIALTTDLKKNNKDLFKEIYPLVYAQKNKEEIENQLSINELFQQNTKNSAFYIYLTIWNNRELVEYYSDILGKAKQKEAEILRSFLRLLKIFQRNDCEKYNKEFVKFTKNTVISEGFIHPFRALNQLCFFELKKYDKIKRTMVKKDKEYIYTSRGAAVVISYYLHRKKFKKLENSIRKMENKASDIYYYEAAARAYINGPRKDRLHRGKFFLEKLLDLDSENYEGLFLLGIISIESGKFKKGEKLLRTIFENKKPSIDKIMAWVDSEVKMDRYKSAVEALDYGLSIHKNNDKLYFQKGKLYSEQNVPTKSIKSLKKISDKGKMVFKKYYLLGKNYLKMRNSVKAEKALAKALTLQKNSPEINFLYGKVLLTRGKISKSTSYLNKSLNIQAVEKKEKKKKFYWVEEAHRLLGGIYKERNNRKKAVYHLRHYARMVPEGPLKDEAMKMLRSLGGDL